LHLKDPHVVLRLTVGFGNVRVAATVFATCDQGLERQGLAVSTVAGAVVRLGNLSLPDIEQMLDNSDAKDDSFVTLLQQIQIERFNVGALNEGARSLLVVRNLRSGGVALPPCLDALAC